MSVKSSIHITHGTETIQSIKDLMQSPSGASRRATVQLLNFFAATGGGNRSSSFQVNVDSGDSAAATGTFSFATHSTAGDTVLINGVTFTAETSGATGNQYNIGTTATQTATNLAAAINGSATALVNQQVTATSALGVVTITSLFSDAAGNAVTIAAGTNAGSNTTVSGARLTGGQPATTIATGVVQRCGL